jgi:hypothetical protein
MYALSYWVFDFPGIMIAIAAFARSVTSGGVPLIGKFVILTETNVRFFHNNKKTVARSLCYNSYFYIKCAKRMFFVL